MNSKTNKLSHRKQNIIIVLSGFLFAALVFGAALLYSLNSNNTNDAVSPVVELEVMLGSMGITNDMLREKSVQFYSGTRVMVLWHNQISDISSLSNLTSLEYLDLSFNFWSNVTQLSPFTNLETLIINRNGITRLDNFPHLRYLTDLDLMLNSVTDVSPLAHLTSLTSLELSQNRVADISPLASLTNLTLLGLSDNEITDVSSLSALIHLTHLDLSHNNISDVSALSSLTSLSSLNLRHNPNLSHEAIHELQNALPNTTIQYSTIEQLERRADFSNSALYDSDLRNLIALEQIEPNVRYLNLSNNNIILAGMLGHPTQGLPELVWLDLSNNDIENITQLSNLTHLQFLDLRYNPRLTEETVDALRAELPDAEILS